MRVVAYTRVSTSMQAESGAGLEAQRVAIRGECCRRDWLLDDVLWFEDAGWSAKTVAKREGLKAALGVLSEGDVLVASKIDRLSRTTSDFLDLVQRARKERWLLLALDAPMDMSTPAGEAMASMQAVFSQLERRITGQRISEAMQAMKAQGKVFGRPRSLDPEVEARLLELHASGRSYNSLAIQFNEERVPTAQGGRWHPNTVRKIVLSRAA